MFLFFLSLRIKQFIRILDELGVLRVFILILAIGFGGKILIPKLLINVYSTLIFVTLLIFIASIHFSRKDKKMLKTLQISRYRLFFLEYFFMSIPFFIILFLSTSYLYIFVTLIFIFLISLFNYTFSFKRKRVLLSLKFLPVVDFEWVSGMRKTWFYLLFFIFLGIGLSKHIFIIPLYFAAISIIIATFYFESEPKNFLSCFGLSANKFLKMKIFSSSRLFTILAIPLFVLFLFMHLDNVLLLLFTMFSSYIIIILSVVLKYAFYEPGKKLENNIIIISLSVFFFLVPYLAAIPLVLLIVYYRKAIRNLKLYL